MRKIIFPKHNLYSVLTGERKTVIQFYKDGSRDFTKGNIVIGEFPEGLSILLRVLRNKKEPTMKEIYAAGQELGLESGEAIEQFLREQGRQSPDHKPDALKNVAIITFEILRSGEEPVASLNEYAPQ